METKQKTKFGYEITKNHAFLLGLNFNTNDHYGFRETYVCVYLGPFTLTIGWCMWETQYDEDDDF